MTEIDEGPINDKFRLEALTRECDSLGRDIRSMLIQNDRTVQVGLAVVGGLAALATSSALLAFSPIIGAIVLISWSINLAEIQALGGYKAAQEERIARLAGEPLIFWEMSIARTRRTNVAQRLTSLLLTVLLTWVTVLGVRSAFESWNFYVALAYAGIVVLALTALATSIVIKGREFDRVRALAGGVIERSRADTQSQVGPDRE